MATDDDTLRLFYGGGTSRRVTPPARPAERAPWAGFYKQTPAPPASTTSGPQDILRLFYKPDVALRTVFQRHRAGLYDAGVSSTALERHERGFVDVVRTHDFTLEDASKVYNLWAEATMRDFHAPPDVAAVTEQVRVWDTETRQQLRQVHGPARADALFGEVERFLTSAPALQRILATGGIGIRPEVMQMLVEHVHRHPELVPPVGAVAAAAVPAAAEERDATG